MSWWRRLRNRDRVENELDAELRDHVERQVAEHVRSGLSAREARRRARLEFGGLDHVKEMCRDVGGARWIDETWQDLRFAVRLLLKERWFTAAAVLALGLGIGLTSTGFTVYNAMLVRGLPVDDQDRIITLAMRDPDGRERRLSYLDFRDWRAEATAFSGIAAYGEPAMTVGDPGLATERLPGARVTANTFRLLGVERQRSLMLEVLNVSKYYGGLAAVRGVSFTARRGEVLGYLGPNGSGKSTTVNMVAGLLEPTLGKIRVDGEDIHRDVLAHRRRIGYVPETPDVYSYLTGPEYLTLVGRLRRIAPDVLEEKIERFLRLFDIYGDRYAQLSGYSKGMRQKVLIAAGLLHDPEIVILDEPSSGLDVGTTLVLKQLIRALAAEGKIVLYSSHVLEIVEQVCSSVVILRDGQVAASDRIERLEELMNQPSLEQVFTRLAVQDDAGEVAGELVEAMKL